MLLFAVSLIVIFSQRLAVSAFCSSREIICFCGNNKENKICLKDVERENDVCEKFKHCEACDSSLKKCTTCATGFSGPYCTEKSIECPNLSSPKLGSISCFESSRKRECTGRCLPGHSFLDSENDEIILSCKRGRWSPMRTFPPCVSEGYCKLEMTDAGSYNCTTDVRGTFCDIWCRVYPDVSGRYFCYPGKPWDPSLPHCIKDKDHEQPVKEECYCENDGTCDYESGICRCPPHYSGVRCEQYHEQPVREECYCENDGTCDYNSGICHCSPHYSGVRCEQYSYPVTAYCHDPGQIPNGDRMEIDGRISAISQTYEAGKAVIFTCHEGFALLGPSLLTCGSDGLWSNPLPVCRSILEIRITTTITRVRPIKKLICADPGFALNAERYDPDGKISKIREGFEEGKTVVYSCNPGYTLKGQNVIFCLSSGRWSSTKPLCRRITTTSTTEDPQSLVYCDDPGVDPNGFRIKYPWINPRSLTSRNDKFLQGMKIDFGCKERYLLVGQKSIICLVTKQWSAPIPNCHQATPSATKELVYCRNPGYLVDGERKVFLPLNERRREINTESAKFPEGTEIKYSCLDGFNLQGVDTLRCLENSSWSADVPYCIGDCGYSLVHLGRRIVHGSWTEPGEWPWQVAIARTVGNHSQIHCGGVLINQRTVLTAAHCLPPDKILKFYFGKYYFSTEKDDDKVAVRNPTYYVISYSYNPDNLDNDIALVRFFPDIKYSQRIQPICLPTPESTRRNLALGAKGWVTGWGLTEKNVEPDVLLMASVPVLPTEDCLEAYREQELAIPLTNNMFCAGYEEGKVDSCSGDSGGPLVFLDPTGTHFILEGIVSFGVHEGCGLPKKYTVYTKIGNYVKWIKKYS